MPERQQTIIVKAGGDGCLSGCGAAGCGAVVGTVLTLVLVFLLCTGLLAMIAGQGK